MYKMKKVKVEIDGHIYDSLTEGANAMGWKLWNLADALRFGKKELHGHSIKRLDDKYTKVLINKQVKKDGRGSNRSCPVLCTTTGETFRSISEAADNCNANSWTMGLKMAKAGKFIDSKGREYIRQKDANYTREYPTQTPNMQHIITKHSIRTTNKIASNKLSETDTTALRNVTINMIQNKQYNEATTLLNILKNNI